MSLQQGLVALKEKRYKDAIELLENYCQTATNIYTKQYSQAKMALVKAYSENEQAELAKALCLELQDHLDSQVSLWAREYLKRLKAQENPTEKKKETRGPVGVKLAMKGIAGSLALASSVTLSLLLGMVLVLSLSLFLIIDSENPGTGLLFSLGLTLVFSFVSFLVSPVIMDVVQSVLYQTNWVSLEDIRFQSPQSAQIIERVCRQKKLKLPRLGIIDDQNPTAFTYGSFPNSARLVVSEGLFTYLDDDEAATVYAHELGHIVHWDFAVMTLGSTLVQVTYLIYSFLRRISQGGSNKAKDAAQQMALAAYAFYLIGTYLLLYLSRTREYYADHFAAEMTGNPNGLSRALVKIAYGIVEEGKKEEEPSRLIQGTRALGIFDPKAAPSTGNAYCMASDPYQVGRVFLWDLFNPWGWWMELNSTHPLTGKRIRALTTYTEQMGLKSEFDMARVIRDGKYLDKRRLYGTFFLDLFLINAQWIGAILGGVVGEGFARIGGHNVLIVSLSLWGLALGTAIKVWVMYPTFHLAPPSELLTLMGDPYASPLRGKPVCLKGELIGRADAGYRFGSDLKLQDPTGMIGARYSSYLGAVGNFLFGATLVQKLIGEQVKVVGWFRRGVMPSLDLMKLNSSVSSLYSYPRLSMILLSFGAIIVGFVIL